MIRVVSEESADTLKKAEAEKPATVNITSEIPHGHGRHQRPSLNEFLTGGDLGRHHTSKSASEQLIQQKGWNLLKCRQKTVCRV